jgi:NADPH-dependent ferric siderophore reductase
MTDKIRRTPPVDVTVVATRSITPQMKRITFQSDALRLLPAKEPAWWVKVLLPANEDERPQSRAYTIRRFDRAAAQIDIDFVLHGDGGPGSAWATEARPGETIRLAGPRSSRMSLPEEGWLLLAGDETALPAIATILEGLPDDRDVIAFIEVDNAAEEQTLAAPRNARIHWRRRAARTASPGTLLCDAVGGTVLPPGPGYAFVAAEAFAVQAIKKRLLDTLAPERISAKGYWKMGTAGHKDRDGVARP